MARTTILLASLLTLPLLAAPLRAQLPLLHGKDGAAPGDRLGSAVSDAGDVNGDGFADFIIGSPGEDAPGLDSGAAHVYSGKDGALIFTIAGEAAGDQLGYSVASAGDVDRDGRADVIVGAPFSDHRRTDGGLALVYSGAGGSVIHGFDGDSSGSLFGWAVGGAGDVDADGHDDLIVGAPFDTIRITFSGSARVFSGRDGRVIHTFEGTQVEDFFGVSVDGAGDVDGDAFDDVIVGCNQLARGGAGYVRVFSGQNGSILLSASGDSGGDLFGSSVSGAGDGDGDRVPDFMVGAPGVGFRPGFARLFSGRGNPLFTFAGAASGDSFGVSVGGAGDVNGDGFPDVIAGATGSDVAGPNFGGASVFCGLTGALLLEFHGAGASDHFGGSVSGAGDSNGDGFLDVIVGAYSDQPHGADSGSARVLAVCGTRIYGEGLGGQQTLTLEWLPGSLPFANPGTLTIAGGTPLSPGLLAVSLASDDRTIAGAPILIDLGFFFYVPVQFDAAGITSILVDLRQPPFAGTTLFSQAFLLSARILHSSNGLEILLCQ